LEPWDKRCIGLEQSEPRSDDLIWLDWAESWACLAILGRVHAYSIARAYKDERFLFSMSPKSGSRLSGCLVRWWSRQAIFVLCTTKRQRSWRFSYSPGQRFRSTN